MLVDTQQQAVEVYRREQDTFWKFTPFGPDDQVELASIGARFPVAAVYENVALPEDIPDET